MRNLKLREPLALQSRNIHANLHRLSTDSTNTLDAFHFTKNKPMFRRQNSPSLLCSDSTTRQGWFCAM